MALTWAVNFTGTPDSFDQEAAMLIINQRNAEIQAENASRAAQDPPLDPLSQKSDSHQTAAVLPQA